MRRVKIGADEKETGERGGNSLLELKKLKGFSTPEAELLMPLSNILEAAAPEQL